jgi:hypothetical protein
MSELSVGPELALQGGKAQARGAGYPDPGTSSELDLTTVSAPTAVPNGKHIRVVSTAACFIALGKDNTITVDTTGKDMYIPANTPTLVFVGQDAANAKYTYLAAATLTGTGKLYISPMNGI